MNMKFWLLAFPGWTKVGLSDGALKAVAPALPQLRYLMWMDRP